ncbi:hypothetical protein FKG94_16030 [Exilibacterium tricleocarpae]|uniref:Uncharacterized protein n=1 Tax=Exilibacterium tricleocarpae TaxID=2591008 RepID=A0A545TBC5_9GAMM|nr:hypothetical protein [Exilibacterium tricleocarpae]TQV74523.1 hypothetical protein FKG94_16030 [Exilibacterium tricleocarpae]
MSDNQAGTAPQEPAAGAEPKYNINLVQVADLGCGVLNQMFLKQPKDKAKLAFKNLKNGKSIKLGTLNLQRKKKDTEEVVGQIDVAVSLKLDRREFRGPVNFPSFQAAVQALLLRLTEHLRAKKDLNLLTDPHGAALIHVPGVIKIDDNYNVLVMVVQPEGHNAIAINLMFIDPDQYEQLRDKNKDAVAES